MTTKITLSNMWKDTFVWNICAHMVSACSLGCSVLSNQGIFNKQISLKLRCQIAFQVSLLFSRGERHNELSVILYKVKFVFKENTWYKSSFYLLLIYTLVNDWNVDLYLHCYYYCMSQVGTHLHES